MCIYILKLRNNGITGPGYEFTGIVDLPYLNVVDVTTRMKAKTSEPSTIFVLMTKYTSIV